VKYLTLYPDDFRNINDWYEVCDQLQISRNTLVIDIELTKVSYEDSLEKNTMTYPN
jgi:hypothetical protein